MNVSKSVLQYLLKHFDDWHEGVIADITIRRMENDIVYILAIQSKYRPNRFYSYPLSCGAALMEFLRISNLREARGVKVEFNYGKLLRLLIRSGYARILTMKTEYSETSYYELIEEFDEVGDYYI